MEGKFSRSFRLCGFDLGTIKEKNVKIGSQNLICQIKLR